MENGEKKVRSSPYACASEPATKIMKKYKEEYTNPTAVSIEISEMPSADELDKIFILTGSSNYSEVLKSYAFVDKTLHIRSIVQDKGPILFSGPFRCGKSTNINMINYFLAIEVDSEGNKVENVLKNADGKWVEKEIQTEKFQHFKNLNIFKCQHETKHTDDECLKGECLHRNFFYENCGQHPVIFISFKNVSYHSNKLEKSLNESIRDTFLRHPYLGEDAQSRLPPSFRKFFSLSTDLFSSSEFLSLKFLAVCFKIQFQKKSFVLVDEYDAPFTCMLRDSTVDEKQVQSIINSIGCVIGSVLKDNPNISGSVVNASMEMKGTLSCHANNVMACTFLEDPIYKDYLGFTATEGEELLKKPLFQKLDKVDLQEFYDGYKVLNFNIKIYNTYSIVMYLNQWIRHMKMKHKEKENPKNDDCKPKKYWVDRGINLSKVLRTNKLLEMAVVLCGSGTATVQAIENKMTICHLLSLRKLLCEPDDVVLNDELVALFFHFLKNRGYLCITEETANTITLSVPNKEIQISLIRDIFYSGLCAKLYRLDHKNYINALKKLDMDAESTFQDFANSIVSMFLQKSWAKTHDELKGIMFAFAFKYDMFSKVESECYVVPERRFQADLVIIKKDGIGITVEIASGNDSEEEALQKIFDKQYFKALPDSIEQKIYIGLQFNYSNGSANICSKVTSGKTPNSEITAAKFNEFKIIHCSALQND